MSWPHNLASSREIPLLLVTSAIANTYQVPLMPLMLCALVSTVLHLPEMYLIVIVAVTLILSLVAEWLEQLQIHAEGGVFIEPRV